MLPTNMMIEHLAKRMGCADPAILAAVESGLPRMLEIRIGLLDCYDSSKRNNGREQETVVSAVVLLPRHRGGTGTVPQVPVCTAGTTKHRIRSQHARTLERHCSPDGYSTNASIHLVDSQIGKKSSICWF